MLLKELERANTHVHLLVMVGGQSARDEHDEASVCFLPQRCGNRSCGNAWNAYRVLPMRHLNLECGCGILAVTGCRD